MSPRLRWSLAAIAWSALPICYIEARWRARRGAHAF